MWFWRCSVARCHGRGVPGSLRAVWRDGRLRGACACVACLSVVQGIHSSLQQACAGGRLVSELASSRVSRIVHVCFVPFVGQHVLSLQTFLPACQCKKLECPFARADPQEAGRLVARVRLCDLQRRQLRGAGPAAGARDQRHAGTWRVGMPESKLTKSCPASDMAAGKATLAQVCDCCECLPSIGYRRRR